MGRKKEIRDSVLKLRNLLSDTEWEQCTKEIQRNLFQHKLFQEADDVYCYIDYNKEVGTKDIIEECWYQDKRVWVPKIYGTTMEFCKITSFDELCIGLFGIREPEGETVADGMRGLVLMPGVAFDCRKNRIGYGGGYYDKYLGQHPNLRKIALAFDIQIVDKVPCEATDIKPELIITETKILGD